MSETGQTIIKMIDALPLHIQERILREIRLIVADAIDESAWQNRYTLNEGKLIAVAKRVRQQIAAGKAKPMDHSKL